MLTTRLSFHGASITISTKMFGTILHTTILMEKLSLNSTESDLKPAVANLTTIPYLFSEAIIAMRGLSHILRN